MSFRKATLLVAMLATLLIASTPLVLAQQQEGIPSPGEAATSVSNEGTGYASPEVAGTNTGTLVSPEGISPNDPDTLQYDTAPAPVVPPGYQKVGDAYCPTFDPHGPPCFRAP